MDTLNGTGGDMAMASRQFLEWAAAYETAGLEQFRTLATHEQWLTKQRCPVQRLDAAMQLAVLANLSEIGRSVQTNKLCRDHTLR
jgi:hypothetical protein